MNIYKQRTMKRLFGDGKFNDINKEFQLEMNIDNLTKTVFRCFKDLDTEIRQAQTLRKNIEDQHDNGKYNSAAKLSVALRKTTSAIRSCCQEMELALKQLDKDSKELIKLQNN